MGFAFAAKSIGYASPSILKQPCLKTRASMLKDSAGKTVFKMVIQGHSRSSVSTSMKSHWGTAYPDIIILVSYMNFEKIYTT